MKMWQFVIALILGFICLGLAGFGIVTGRSNQLLQTEVQQQQLEISKGNLTQQVGTNLVREIAAKASANENLKNLLIRNGFTFSENAAPGQQPPQQPPTAQQQHPAASATPKR